MLRRKASIGYLGLPEREIAVIQSIFGLTQQFSDAYESPRERERRRPDVVFVNADDGRQLVAWEQYKKRKPKAIPIFISSVEGNFAKGIFLKRPLVAKKVIEALEAAWEIYSKALSAERAATDSEQHLKILVVDDSLRVRVFMQQHLKTLAPIATHADFAENGVEAVSWIKAGGRYDLVFLDAELPDSDSYKICKWIKQFSKSTQVVMLTRDAPLDVVRRAMSGCDDHIVKPLRDGQLKLVLNQQIKLLGKKTKAEAEGLDSGQLFKT